MNPSATVCQPWQYDAPQHHVRHRSALPTQIQQTLLQSTREQWQSHPQFGGKASFFMRIHADLINGAAHLSEQFQLMLDAPNAEIEQKLRHSDLLPFSQRLIAFARHHHDIEDHNYFPTFVRHYPKMEQAFALLDGDHTVLNQALDNISQALSKIDPRRATRDDMAGLYRDSQALSQILTRHIHDEEEVIIPIFLPRG